MKKIAEKISGGAIPRGCTFLDAEGYYTGHKTKLILTVTRKREAPAMYRLVDEIDPHAFVTQSQVTGVYGNGFDRLKVKHKKRSLKQNKE